MDLIAMAILDTVCVKASSGTIIFQLNAQIRRVWLVYNIYRSNKLIRGKGIALWSRFNELMCLSAFTLMLCNVFFFPC